MTANAEIVLEEHQNSLIVPEAAISTTPASTPFVEVLGSRRETGRRRVPVKLGVGNGTQTQVLERRQGRRQGRCCRVAQTTMSEAVAQVVREPARQQAAQLPDDVRHPVGRDLGRHPVGHRRGLPAGQRARAARARQEHRHRLGRPHQHAGRRRASRPADPPDRRRCARDRARGAPGGGRQPGDPARRRQGEEPLQRRRAAGARHRAAVSGHPHPRPRARPAAELGRRAAGRAASRSSAPTAPSSCSASATSDRRDDHAERHPLRVVGKIRKKDQDSNYSGPDNDKLFVPFAAMAQDFPRPDAEPGRCRDIIVAPQPASSTSCRQSSPSAPAASRTSTGRSSASPRRPGAAATASTPTTAKPSAMWDTSMQSLMFGRMVDDMRHFFTHRRRRHAGARRHRRDEHHADRGQGADARDRRAQGAGRDDAGASSGSSSSKASS